jgi:hypothetical protein
MRRSKNLHAGLLLAAGTVFVLGCKEEKLTYERWQLINQGSTSLEVESAIGEPSFTTNNQWTYQDHDRGITAHIYFEPGTEKVLSKQWIDAEHGWQGQNPSEAGGQGQEGGESQSRSDMEGDR